MEKRLLEIETRKAEIAELVNQEGQDLETLNAEVDALNAEAKELRAKQEIAKKISSGNLEGRKIDKPGEERKMENKEEILASQEYRSAFLKNLQGVKLTEAEQRAYDTGSGSGAAVPTQTNETLFMKMVKLAPMLSEITLLRVAGNVQFSAEGVRNAAAQHTENAAITGATDTLVKVSLTGYEFNKLIYISKAVQTMSVNAFEGWLLDMIAADIATALEDQIINGTGSTAPKGIEKANTWATASLNYVQCTGTFVITYSDILNLISLLPARYDANAKFLASKAMAFQGLANIKDTTGRPIFVLDATGQNPARILGYPVLISDKVAAKTLYFGDFKKVVGNLAQDIVVEKDASAGFASNSIAYRGGAIFDCNIALADAFVKLTTLTY